MDPLCSVDRVGTRKSSRSFQLVELCCIPVEQRPAVLRIAPDNDVAGVRQGRRLREVERGLATFINRLHRDRGAVAERDRPPLAAAVDGVDRLVKRASNSLPSIEPGMRTKRLPPQPLLQWLEAARKGVAFRLTLERSPFDLAEAREDDDLWRMTSVRCGSSEVSSKYPGFDAHLVLCDRVLLPDPMASVVRGCTCAGGQCHWRRAMPARCRGGAGRGRRVPQWFAVFLAHATSSRCMCSCIALRNLDSAERGCVTRSRPRAVACPPSGRRGDRTSEQRRPEPAASHRSLSTRHGVLLRLWATRASRPRQGSLTSFEGRQPFT